MENKKITIVVSDLHLGGGIYDPGDDHVYQNGQFQKFISEGIPESKQGEVELFINGDFLEFAQVETKAYRLGSAKYWCSEDESVEKLSAIIKGHSDIFTALKDFQERGNVVTIAAGNHDVDLYWKRVQEKIREVAGPVNFEVGKEWYFRYKKRLAISHGHLADPANKFKKWHSPILKGPKGVLRLEMCPGTLFMVKFINGLERKYPFIDNVKPLFNLAAVLLKEAPLTFGVAVLTLLYFSGRHPRSALSSRASGTDARSAFAGLQSTEKFANKFILELKHNEQFANIICELYQKLGSDEPSPVSIRKRLKNEEAVFNFLAELIVGLSPEEWMNALAISNNETLAVKRDGRKNTLGVAKASAYGKDKLLNIAKSELRMPGREIVVCGHTHQPDEWHGKKGNVTLSYFNPGSWTRYVDIRLLDKIKLKDLKIEEDFPYQLNYIRIEHTGNGELIADKICYEQMKGKNRFTIK